MIKKRIFFYTSTFFLLIASLYGVVHYCYEYLQYEVTDADQVHWRVEVECCKRFQFNDQSIKLEQNLCVGPDDYECSIFEREMRTKIINEQRDCASDIQNIVMRASSPPEIMQEMVSRFPMGSPVMQRGDLIAQVPFARTHDGRGTLGIRINQADTPGPNGSYHLSKEELQRGPKVLPFLKSNAYFKDYRVLTVLGPREQDFFAHFSQEDYQAFFSDIFGGSIGIVDQAKIINTFALYQFSGFREFIKTLKEFRPHVAQLEQRMNYDEKLIKEVNFVQGFVQDSYLDRLRIGLLGQRSFVSSRL